jgi:hypothetical protein
MQRLLDDTNLLPQLSENRLSRTGFDTIFKGSDIGRFI